MGGVCRGKKKKFYVWARGAEGLTLPEGVGFG